MASSMWQFGGGDVHLGTLKTSSKHHPLRYWGPWSWRGFPTTMGKCVTNHVTWKRHLTAFLLVSSPRTSSLAAMWATHLKKQPYGPSCGDWLLQSDTRRSICVLHIYWSYFLEFWGQHEWFGKHVDAHKLFGISRVTKSGAPITKPW